MRKARFVMAACAAAFLMWPALPARAISGGKTASGKDGLHHSIVRIESGLGEVCSGVLVAPDIVLTAAHCVALPSDYKAVILNERFKPANFEISSILMHPSFVAGTTPNEQPGTDLALALLAEKVPASMLPADLSDVPDVDAGTKLDIAGYGTSSYRNKRSVRVLRSASLTVLSIHQPPNDLVFAADKRYLGRTTGAGACLGDSGGPALVRTPQGIALGGIISWAAGIEQSENTSPCGGITVITPLKPHAGWLVRSIKRLQRL